MSGAFKQTGGARLGSINATWPFASLFATSEELQLACLGCHYKFPRSTIQRLGEYRGYFSTGLRIEHSNLAIPAFVVFWTSVFFWTAPFQLLKRRLQDLGYEVHAG